jgi:hypothetical protein
MRQVSEKELENRLRLDNPWWDAGAGIDAEYQMFPRRAYLSAFVSLVRQVDVNRAVVLLGPRRVGKTVLVYHCVQNLLDSKTAPGRDVFYLSLETPLFTGLTLESLVGRFRRLFVRPPGATLYVFFDEVQYLRDWQVHLKSLVDTYRDCRFVATGSAAAALRTKSAESGAGRFTEFVLPPLTFAEYLRFIRREEELIAEAPEESGVQRFTATNIHGLNDEFINYLNFGGYPEAVFKEGVRADPRRFIKSDIIDKVLLRDLPSLYGISDVQELNSLFNTLAYNTAGELSLEALSKTAHVTKNTLMRYLEYLEAAFLIRRMRRVDQDAAHLKRDPKGDPPPSKAKEDRRGASAVAPAPSRRDGRGRLADQTATPVRSRPELRAREYRGRTGVLRVRRHQSRERRSLPCGHSQPAHWGELLFLSGLRHQRSRHL